MLNAVTGELPVCLDNNSEALSPDVASSVIKKCQTAKKVGVVRVRSLDDIIHCSVISPGEVLLSKREGGYIRAVLPVLLPTAQALGSPSGALLSAHAPARAGGLAQGGAA